ncbi:MAG: TIGR04076 family protein [Clostridiaceae bacterium]|nr:TIGR04076 family protein [Clostridiaceae bacterium]
MKKVKITVKRIVVHQDLIDEYENPIENACNLAEGQVFVANGWRKPEEMCDSAWETMSPFVMTLAHGGEDIYSGWMKNKKSAMISCNDGFRPVSFLLEALDEDADLRRTLSGNTTPD